MLAVPAPPANAFPRAPYAAKFFRQTNGNGTITSECARLPLYPLWLTVNTLRHETETSILLHSIAAVSLCVGMRMKGFAPGISCGF